MEEKNHYCIDVKFSKSLMDERLVPLFKQYGSDVRKVSKVAHDYWDNCWNPLAARLTKFLFKYHDGLLVPNKWGFDDPPRDSVDFFSEEKIVHYISRPCVQLLLKRNKPPKMNIFLSSITPEERPQNYTHLWGGYSYGELSIWLDRRVAFSLTQWEPVMHDLCQELETDYGYIYELDPHCLGVRNLLATDFSFPYHEYLGRSADEILSARRMVSIINDFSRSDFFIIGVRANHFYPSVYQNITSVDYGKYAYGLMRDALKAENLPYQTGLLFRGFFHDSGDISWTTPKCFIDSIVYVSKQDLLCSFGDFYKISHLPNHFMPPFEEFKAGYLLEERNSHRSNVLLLP